MPRAALGLLLLSMNALSLSVRTGESRETTAGGVLRANGLPAFVALSARVHQDRLEVTRFEEVATRGDVGNLRACVLLYCTESDSLCLWMAKVAWNMKQASPGLGHEGPGVTFHETVEKSRNVVEELVRPVQIALVFVDDVGNVSQTQTVRIARVLFRSVRT